MQQAYKRDYNKRINKLRLVHVGEPLHVELQCLKEDITPGVRQRYKLQPKSEGPYKILDEGLHTVTIKRDGMVEKVSRDRVSRALPLLHDDNSTHASELESQGSLNTLPADNASHSTAVPAESTINLRLTSAPVPSSEAVIDQITDYDEPQDLFRVLWLSYGPEIDTWEPPSHLRYNQMAAYLRGKKLQTPKNLSRFKPQAWLTTDSRLSGTKVGL